MAAALAGAIVSLLGTAANLGMGIWSNQKAKNAKTGQIGVSGAEQAALTSSRYIADRMAMQGGMSAAQYQRALQEPDLQAAMTQQTVNQLATSPFQDSFQREALAKVMMSRMFAERQRTFQNIADIDAAQIARNVSSAFGMQAQVAQQEAMAQAQRNAIIARNEQIQIDRANNLTKMISAIAQMGGMSAEGLELAIKEKRAQTAAEQQAAAKQKSLNKAVAANSGVVKAIDDKYWNLNDETTNRVFGDVAESNLDDLLGEVPTYGGGGYSNYYDYSITR